MELEVGMYVRTLNGIVKIDKIQDNIMEDTKGHLHYGDFVKASYNIIDILEVGDYVNGVEVINIDNEWITMSDMQVPILKSIANGMIETIVTKEQFEQMAYKVGE